jgi:hypothetical protein
MSGDESAYSVLGLRPGASRADIDLAYRRLIKRFHPDRTGGDGTQAAEINRAYTQLRGKLPAAAPPRRPPVPVYRPRPPRARRRVGWLLGCAVVVVAIGTLAGEVPRRGPHAIYAGTLPWGLTDNGSSNTVAVVPLTNFDEPIQDEVVDRAVADAVKFHSGKDLSASLAYSRACHDRLRQERTLAWFDACAAFDEATVTINDDTVADDSGPFTASAVIARQMASARMLTDDMLEADSRLHDIRSRVEFQLLPALDEAAGQKL